MAPMDTYKSLDSIRVVREFADRPLDDDALRLILHAGRRAGSSKNLQRWAFVVIRERSHLEELATAGPWAGHIAGAAAAIALVSPDPKAPDAALSIMWDLGRAAQNMVLAAWDLGIGSAPATVYEHELVARSLGLPPDMHCEFILSFGYPAESKELTAPKRRGGRVTLEEIVHDERWSG